MKYNVTLKGKRTKTDPSLKKIINFDNPHIVKVTKTSTFFGIIDKIVATPMAIVVDAIGLPILLISGEATDPLTKVLPHKDE